MEPAHDADLPALAAWIERWLPVVGATSYSNVDSTADFYGRASDSVMAARLEGCTLVLHERSVSIVRGWRSAKYLAIHVPLDQVDTSLLQPKIRQARLLLNRPNVLLYGQLVVPLRNRARTEFITVFAEDGRGDPTGAVRVRAGAGGAVGARAQAGGGSLRGRQRALVRLRSWPRAHRPFCRTRARTARRSALRRSR